MPTLADVVNAAPVSNATVRRRRFTVTGVVQGVGFRPFVWRLAASCGVSGWVANVGSGVVLEAEGDAAALARLALLIEHDPPAAARIERVEAVDVAVQGAADFVIAASRTATVLPTGMASVVNTVGEVAVDRAMCPACRDEIDDPAARRYRYPFTNCTECGPRYTVTLGLPYDRAATTMASFEMCPACRAEYRNPTDRRHHAQPIACSGCGPTLWFDDGSGAATRGIDASLAAAQRVIAAGGIVAMLGVGGYHLLCDATNDSAVRRLRQRKARPDKPFAVMAPDVAGAVVLGRFSAPELAALDSPAAPIVLVPRRAEPVLAEVVLAESVLAGSPLVGVMLASNPLHHLLFQPVPGRALPPPRVVVATSGNRASEPVTSDPGRARDRLGDIADAFVHHDRPIAHPIDDSVVRSLGGRVTPVRRARGLGPASLDLPVCVEPTLAVGGELKSTFCLAAGTRALLGPHIGDMGDLATLDAFEDALDAASSATGIVEQIVAADSHPDYVTHRWAQRRGSRPVLVQHHHAHAMSLVVDGGLDLRRPLLSFVFDGTGYGETDGAAESWGGEVLIADHHGARRVAHLEAMPLPGGDSAVRYPCRTAVAYLCRLGIELDDAIPAVVACDATERQVVARQVATGVGITPTTSMGRLIDVVASLIGVRHRVTYEAQAALELEGCGRRAARSATGRPDLRFVVNADGTIGLGPLVSGVVAAVLDATPVEVVAHAFWRAVATMIGEVSAGVAGSPLVEARPLATDAQGRILVGLTGGVFQNAVLVDMVQRDLAARGLVAVTHRRVPPNDGGLALGQAVIAGTVSSEGS